MSKGPNSKKVERLDVLISQKKPFLSREQAQRYILAGLVYVNDKQEIKPGMRFDTTSKLLIKKKQLYVSKGGDKIKSAYSKFKINFNKKIVADIGSSTGGFTDFALKHGAARVYAVDVGYGQLAQKLRDNKKVIVMEKTNIRDVASFSEIIDVFLIDVSFISLKKILPIIKSIIISQKQEAEVIALVKPQFEAGKKEVDKSKGVIKDEELQLKIVGAMMDFANQIGFQVFGFVKALLKGEKGNQEYFVYLKYSKL